MLLRYPGLTRSLPTWLRNLNFTGRTVTAGTFAGDHAISQRLRLTGILTPAQITADQNNYSPTGIDTAGVLRLNSDGTVRNIRGLDANPNTEGRMIQIVSTANAGIFLPSEDGSATAANRFSFQGGGVYMPPGTTFFIIYDATAQRWRGLSSSTVTASTGVFGVSRYASSSEYRQNVDDNFGAVITPRNAWTAAQPFGLTDAATIAVDFNNGFNFTVTLGGNRTLGNPSNQKHQSGWFAVTQDGTGSRTLAYSSDWEFAGATAFTLSTAAGAKDILFYSSLAANSHVLTGILKNVS